MAFSLTIVAMETQQYIPFVFLLTYTYFLKYKTSVAMETKQLVPSVLFPSYKMFCTAVNNVDILRYSCRVPDIVVLF